MSEETQEVQSSGTEISTAVTQDSQPTQAPSKEVLSPEKGAQSSQEEVESQYQPNYKFKYAVKGAPSAEKEFDEFVRAGIKDQETEKKARELYEKAYGLDFVKPEYEDLKKKYPEMESSYKQLDSAVNEVLDLGEKDLGLFFERLKIPEERVAQWMLERIRKMELPPEQKAMYDQFEQTKRQNLEYQRQFETLNLQNQAQAVQARTFELENTLQRPEVSSFGVAFDAARGNPGAFRKEIQECGLYEWKVNGRDISAGEATQMVMSRYQGLINPAATGNPPPGQAIEQLPVIPRMQGRSVSAVGKQVRSIQDLRKKYEEVAG